MKYCCEESIGQINALHSEIDAFLFSHFSKIQLPQEKFPLRTLYERTTEHVYGNDSMIHQHLKNLPEYQYMHCIFNISFKSAKKNAFNIQQINENIKLNYQWHS